jgi:hypothetical protein
VTATCGSARPLAEAVFGEHAQHTLQHEALYFQGSERSARHAPLAQPGKQFPHAAGLGFGDGDRLRPKWTGCSLLLKTKM